MRVQSKTHLAFCFPIEFNVKFNSEVGNNITPPLECINKVHKFGRKSLQKLGLVSTNFLDTSDNA